MWDKWPLSNEKEGSRRDTRSEGGKTNRTLQSTTPQENDDGLMVLSPEDRKVTLLSEEEKNVMNFSNFFHKFLAS